MAFVVPGLKCPVSLREDVDLRSSQLEVGREVSNGVRLFPGFRLSGLVAPFLDGGVVVGYGVARIGPQLDLSFA